jgi:hypothetical protein
MLVDLVKFLKYYSRQSPQAVEANPGEEAPSLLWIRTLVPGPLGSWKHERDRTKTTCLSERKPKCGGELEFYRTERLRLD